MSLAVSLSPSWTEDFSPCALSRKWPIINLSEILLLRIQLEDELVQPPGDGNANVRVCNLSGFTGVIRGGTVLGEAVEATEILPCDSYSNKLPRAVWDSSDQKSFCWLRWQEKTGALEKAGRAQFTAFLQDFLHNFLADNHLAFSVGDGDHGEVEMVIDTCDVSPKKQALRSMPLAARSRQLKEMQSNGVIQPYTSPWSSPIVLVQKKDGTLRFGINYWGLNAVTKADTFPWPHIDDLLDQLGKSCYFSTLDLSLGFWQIKIHPDLTDKTSFSTPQGLYVFRVMSFGLTQCLSKINATSTDGIEPQLWS